MQGILHFYKKVLISRNWQVYSKQQKKKNLLLKSAFP